MKNLYRFIRGWLSCIRINLVTLCLCPENCRQDEFTPCQVVGQCWELWGVCVYVRVCVYVWVLVSVCVRESVCVWVCMWSHVIPLLLTNEETKFLRGLATSPCLSESKACGVHTPGDAPDALCSEGPTGQQDLQAVGWPTTPAAPCGVSLRKGAPGFNRSYSSNVQIGSGIPRVWGGNGWKEHVHGYILCKHKD